MSFVSLKFFPFLFITVCLFYILPVKARKSWLLIASYYFYIGMDIRLFLWLISITTVNFIGGRLIEKTNGSKKVYAIFFTVDILCLILFKYIEFFAKTVERLFLLGGLTFHVGLPEIFLPIGISFIIFQAVTYLGDIYKGRLKSQNFITVALFISFFPTVLSGPINKAHELIPQFNFKNKVEEDSIKRGIFLILFGLFEKLFVAGSLARIVNTVFDSYASYQGMHYIIAAVSYAFQIYADFSAYSDIARGCAQLLGIYVKENFRTPYLSQSLSEFWKRWHMSLNAWFVEYVYIPLGGNRGGGILKYINVMVVFGLSGLWHGSTWHFIAWGVINGILQIFGQLTKNLRYSFWNFFGINETSCIKRQINRITVFTFITFTWIYFRAPSIGVAHHMVKKIYRGGILQLFQSEPWALIGNAKSCIFLVAYLIIFFIVSISGKENGEIFAGYLKEPKIIQETMLAVLLFILIVSLCSNYANPDNAFIYFQF